MCVNLDGCSDQGGGVFGHSVSKGCKTTDGIGCFLLLENELKAYVRISELYYIVSRDCTLQLFQAMEGDIYKHLARN